MQSTIPLAFQSQELQRTRLSLFDQQEIDIPLPHGEPPPPNGLGFTPCLQPIAPPTHSLDLTPKVPFYVLPAGLIVPLVKLEDVTYKPLKEKDIRLPMPGLPSENMLREVDRFYTTLQIPLPIDCIRDNDGWELNGLVEHFLKKREYRNILEAELKKGGKTLEDAFTNKYIPHKSSPKSQISTERYRRRRSRSKSSSSTSSRTYSCSRNSSSCSSRSSSYSPRRNSKSVSPVVKRVRRSRSPTPGERPSFAAPVGPALRSSTSFKIPSQPLNRETNKGAQLMTKMGWEGKGLGTKEQGIEEPVNGGEVRDKIDKYRGLGSKPDIYEQYRKQMSTSLARRINKLN